MFRNQRLVLAIVLSLALLPSVAMAGDPASESSPSPEDLAHQMIQLSGGGNLGKQVMTQVLANFREINPTIPEEFWTELSDSVDAKQIEDMVVPIYVKNLTAEEMTAAIQFYSSPAGRSLVQKLPVILQQSMVAGQEWGRKLALDAFERIEKYKKAHPKT